MCVCAIIYGTVSHLNARWIVKWKFSNKKKNKEGRKSSEYVGNMLLEYCFMAQWYAIFGTRQVILFGRIEKKIGWTYVFLFFKDPTSVIVGDEDENGWISLAYVESARKDGLFLFLNFWFLQFSENEMVRFGFSCNHKNHKLMVKMNGSADIKITLKFSFHLRTKPNMWKGTNNFFFVSSLFLHHDSPLVIFYSM